MKKVLLRILLATLVGFTATVAEAATLTFTSGITNEALDVYGDYLNFLQFRSSLGTLNSVQITFNGSVDSSFSIRNNSATTKIATANPAGAFTLYDNQGSQIFSLSTDANTLNVPVSAGNTYPTFSRSASITAQVTTLTSGAQFNAFKGTGIYAFTTDIFAASSVTGTGNFSSIIDSYGNASVEVVYNYTPTTTAVPEPSGAIERRSYGLIVA